MDKLKFNIDRTKAEAGESVNVSWDCENPDMVSLTVEDGQKSVYQLGDSGSRSIKLSGDSDKVVFTLSATLGGKVERSTHTVKVSRKVLKAEKVHRAPRSSSSRKFKMPDFGKVGDWWKRTTVNFKTVWSYLPSDKKLAYKILGILAAISVLSAIFPRLLSLGFLVLGFYLMWFILKR